MNAQETYIAATQALFAVERDIDRLTTAELSIKDQIAEKTLEKAARSNEAEAAFAAWRLVETAP